MKRPAPVMHHLTAAALYAWALVAVSIAWHSTALPAWLTATVVCYLAAIAAYQALQASWRAWRGRKVVPPPSAKAPLWPVHTPTDALIEAYVAERAGGRRHAQPVTATPGPQTQRMPALDDTVRMTAVDLAEWGAFEYGGTR